MHHIQVPHLPWMLPPIKDDQWGDGKVSDWGANDLGPKGERTIWVELAFENGMTARLDRIPVVGDGRLALGAGRSLPFIL